MNQGTVVERPDRFPGERLHGASGEILLPAPGLPRAQTASHCLGEAEAELQQLAADLRRGCLAESGRESIEEPFADEPPARARHHGREASLFEKLEERRAGAPRHLPVRWNELEGRHVLAGQGKKRAAIGIWLQRADRASEHAADLLRRESDVRAGGGTQLDARQRPQPEEARESRQGTIDMHLESFGPPVQRAADGVRFRCLADEEERHRALGIARPHGAPEARQLVAQSVFEPVAAPQRQAG